MKKDQKIKKYLPLGHPILPKRSAVPLPVSLTVLRRPSIHCSSSQGDGSRHHVVFLSHCTGYFAILGTDMFSFCSLSCFFFKCLFIQIAHSHMCHLWLILCLLYLQFFIPSLGHCSNCPFLFREAIHTYCWEYFSCLVSLQ